MKAAVVVSVLLAALPVGVRGDDEVRVYGRPLAGLPPASLADVLDRPQAGRSVRLEGEIAAVCRNKGCWLTLKQGGRAVHVTFAGYAFFVPKDVQGRRAALEGRVQVKTPARDDVAHLEAEGAGDAAAARVSVEADGVEIR